MNPITETTQDVGVIFSRTIANVRPYNSLSAGNSIALPLDKTEPPIPYRMSVQVDSSAIERYPDPRALQSTFAKRFGVTPNNVLVTAGADEALDRACRTFLAGENAELVTIAPTFEMIARYASLAGATVRAANWMDNEFPLDAIIALHSERTRLIVLVSPNNPTGAVIPTRAIVALATRFRNTPIVLDFAYVEFASIDPTLELRQYSNIIIVRTLSKAYGAPGLRVGCAIGEAPILERLLVAGGPYPVSSLSIAIGCTILSEEQPAIENYVKRIQFERTTFSEMLTKLGCAFVRSEANFVLIRAQNDSYFDQVVSSFGINTRAFANDPQLTGMRRITMPGNAEAFERLTNAITIALNTTQQ